MLFENNILNLQDIQDTLTKTLFQKASQRTQKTVRPGDILAAAIDCGNPRVFTTLTQALAHGSTLVDVKEIIEIYNPSQTRTHRPRLQREDFSPYTLEALDQFSNELQTNPQYLQGHTAELFLACVLHHLDDEDQEYLTSLLNIGRGITLFRRQIPIIDIRLQNELSNLYKKLSADNKLFTNEQLNGYYETFRKKFGPEKLLAMEGDELLFAMKGGKEHNGLSYWLEFKNDSEFPSLFFGSIAGGSSHKYGVYQQTETGKWISGTPQREKEVSQEEAIEIAKEHRRQLVDGCTLLDTLPLESDEDYEALQRELQRVAPQVAETTWGHKYFSLLYPDKLEDFHVYSYQYFHMLKLLQAPPAAMGVYQQAGQYTTGGRYLMGGQFTRIARSLGMRVHILTHLLSERNGSPYRYWRIGTKGYSDKQSRWDEMRDANCCTIGWSGIGDLSSLLTLSTNSQRKQYLRETFSRIYPEDNAATITKTTNQIFAFIFSIRKGDLVLVSEGAKVLGVGQITGDYFYDATKGFAHCRPVKWLSLETWQQPDQNRDFEGKLTTVYDMKRPLNLIEAERKILDSDSHTVTLFPPESPEQIEEKETDGTDNQIPPEPVLEFFADEELASIPETRLKQQIARLRRSLLVDEKLVRDIYYALLNRHVILTGPPGTGKTQLAQLIPEIIWQDDKQENLDDKESSSVSTKNAIPAGYMTTLVTATNEWSTHTLISSIMPVIENEKLTYRTQHGYLTEAILRNWVVSEHAGAQWEILGRRSPLGHAGPEQQEERKYRGHWLVIDEFNRAPIDAALGEALTALSNGEALQVPVDGGRVRLPLPKDFRIIGTLNSFDRNYLNQISEALKRRFYFIEIPPPSRKYRQEEQGIVIYKALQQLAHHTPLITTKDEEITWTGILSVRANTDGIYELVWQDKQHPFFSIFTQQLWPLFETIRVYRQLGTAQAIALTSQLLTPGLLQDEKTEEAWQEMLDIAFRDTIADQLQVLLSDELEVLTWCLKLEASKFIDKYNTMLMNMRGKKRRLIAHLEALSIVVNEQGKQLITDEGIEELLEQDEPYVLPEVLSEAFHLQQIPYKLPMFSRRLRNFKAVHGL
ncbi:AAA family ATPase [Ktedonobacter racemifer]|uniref:ATPase associated with various cellular activities AAA_5 n=1 Tax=Ktedonobacter racemifer DSM 44963 TaxID=485913 RepID=D6TX26_KTERA|nr:AAA family ATPase [Ktedonobacter racemifer]EFH84759.1 ATPase associated with various cellular activities AAA_5 [Ktedonobacter racemifer DSM 44963]